MSTRVKVSDKEAQALRKAPVAKGKGIKRQREAEREMEKNPPPPPVKKTAEIPTQTVSAGSIRGVMEETMARVYGEVYSGMSTHNEDHIVDVEIKEEAYILTLTMMFGNETDLPRRGLPVREDAKASLNMKSHKECPA